MASFGEALVGAFNQTYGTVSAARLRDAQARAINDETEANQRQREEVRQSQIRNGILNPDGSTNDPAATPRAPSAPTVAAPAAPAAAPPPDLGAPTSPGLAAGAGQPAAPATGTPAPVAAPPAAPRGAVQGAVAPIPPPAASPPVQGAQPPQQDANGVQGTGPGMVNANEPLIPAEVVQRAAAEVDRLPEAERPVAAMIVAGAMAPPPQQGPGQRRAAEYAPQLVQEVVQNRGEGETGPLTRANWNAYLRDVTLAAQRNLSARDQVQALAVVDRIRTAGLQRFTGLAVAAAQAGDMQGAANALNGASNFNPDGFQDTFRAVNGGVEMVRRPEQGVQGQETRVTVPAADVVRYATAMLDPTWSLNHFLQVRRQDETERHNRVSEGLQAASIAESRAGRAERRAEATRNAENDAAVIRAQRDLERARTDYDEVSRNGGGEPGALAAARLRVVQAQAGLDAAEERGGARAVNMSGGLEERAATRRQREAEGQERRTRVSEQDLTRFDNAADEISDPRARDWARAQGRAYLAGTPGVNPAAVPGILARAYANMPAEARRNPPRSIVDEATGMTLTLPPARGGQARGGGDNAAGEQPTRPAPTEGGGNAPRPGAVQSLAGARTPPAPAPTPAPQLGRPGASTAPLPAVRSLPDRSNEALESAVRAMRTPAGRRQGIEGVARAYGVEVEELRARLR